MRNHRNPQDVSAIQYLPGALVLCFILSLCAECGSACPPVPTWRIQELREKTGERIQVLRFPGGVWIPYNLRSLPPGDELSDVAYLLELRHYVDVLMRYYWNLERVAQAPNRIRGIDAMSLSGSDEPCSYDAIPEELFRQAFGKDSWSNPNPACIDEADILELDAAISRFQWIYIPVAQPYYWTRLFPAWAKARLQASKLARGAGRSLADSWEQTTAKFDSAVLNYCDCGSCWVFNLARGRWDNGLGKYYAERDYAECLLYLDLTYLPFEIRQAKALFFMSYDVSGTDIGDLIPGTVDMGPFGNVTVNRGYNLIDGKIGNQLYEFTARPVQQDVMPVVLSDGKAYGKGFEGYFSGIFLSPYGADCPAPATEVSGVGIKLPAARYDPVWDDPAWSLTMDGSAAGAAAGNTDRVTIEYWLNEAAEKVDVNIYEDRFWVGDSLIESWPGTTFPGMNSGEWWDIDDESSGDYFAEVSAQSCEPDPVKGTSATVTIRRFPYYTQAVTSVADTDPEVTTLMTQRLYKTGVALGYWGASSLVVGSLYQIQGSVLRLIQAGIAATSSLVGIGTTPPGLKAGDNTYRFGPWEVREHRWDKKTRSYGNVQTLNIRAKEVWPATAGYPPGGKPYEPYPVFAQANGNIWIMSVLYSNKMTDHPRGFGLTFPDLKHH